MAKRTKKVGEYLDALRVAGDVRVSDAGY